VSGESVTEPMGRGAIATVIAELPVFESTVPLIVAPPFPTAVTRPVELTVATDVFDELHAVVRPETTVPASSRTVDVSWSVAPAWVRVPLAGVTSTEPIGRGASVTVIVELPTFASTVPEMVAEPAPTAVTSPPVPIVATPVFELLHAMVLPVTTAPRSSRTVALSWTVCPTCVSVAVPGVTSTEATGRGAMVTSSVALPTLESTVPVSVVVPAATARARPFALIVATSGCEVCHCTVRPVTTPP
jgi:hypothetical protein